MIESNDTVHEQVSIKLGAPSSVEFVKCLRLFEVKSEQCDHAPWKSNCGCNLNFVKSIV